VHLKEARQALVKPEPTKRQQALHIFITFGTILLMTLALSFNGFGQQTPATLKGQISDEFGGVIVGASVLAIDASGAKKTATTNGEGSFVISGLAAGKYTVQITAPGFAPYENAEIDLTTAHSLQLDVTLKVTIEQQKVTVTPDSVGVSTEPENNLGAIVIKGEDLESLPDDPDDLVAALQALAGPAAGPNGGQIYIDGFRSGRMPPLSSIREVRINSNPYSAEYDRPGMGRIEILTKPGTDRFRGQTSFSFNNQALNSRNPFALTRAPYMSRQYGGNLSSPISKKKASFFFDFEKRDSNDDAVINATILDSNQNIVPFSATVPIPRRSTTFSPRIDYQLNSKTTLVARYEYEHSRSFTIQNLPYSLPSRKYQNFSTQQTVRLTETSIINRRTVNETRAQFNRQTSGDTASNSIPTTNVQEGFVGGGSQIGQASNRTNRWEVTNLTSLAMRAHSIKFGARIHDTQIAAISPQNFGGTWTFAGTRKASNPNGLTSIQSYQITLQGLQQGLTPAQIRAAGGGATQFTIAAGNPKAAVGQWDFGGFAQDDWRWRTNVMLSFGLRYENQDNISSNLNFAPRLGLAWGLGPSGPQHQPKTVLRAGFGVFYDRVGENLTLTAHRLNGTNQQQYVVTNPTVLNSFSITDGVPNTPSIDTLKAFATPVSTYQLARDIQAPYTIHTVISVERTLPRNLTTSVTFSHARTLHMLRARAINAPLPGTFVPGVAGSGVRPLGSINNFFEYDSTGRFNQNQLIVTLGGRLTRTMNFNLNYAFAKANSDSDSAGTFSANPYDFSAEYGRASTDVRHRLTLFTTLRTRWGLSITPRLIVSSGTPFNITIGRDLNGDTLFTDRPAFATDLTKPGVIVTKFGAFDPNPAPGALIIPRNFGQGPGSIISTLSLAKTFSFGSERRVTPQAQGQGNRGDRGAGGRGAMGGPGGMRGGGAGPRGGGGVGGGGRGGGFAGGNGAPKRYSLTFSVNAQNVLNHVNFNRPVGNLSSSLFGTSNSSAGGFGGFGGRGGGGSAPFNRLIEAQVRFSF